MDEIEDAYQAKMASAREKAKKSLFNNLASGLGALNGNIVN